MMDMKQKTRCVQCNSFRTRFRITTGERVCEHCGHIEPKEIKREISVEEPKDFYGS